VSIRTRIQVPDSRGTWIRVRIDTIQELDQQYLP